MNERASWLIQPIKGDRSKRLFGLPAPLVKGEKIAQFRLYSYFSLMKIYKKRGKDRHSPLPKEALSQHEKNPFLTIMTQLQRGEER